MLSKIASYSYCDSRCFTFSMISWSDYTKLHGGLSYSTLEMCSNLFFVYKQNLIVWTNALWFAFTRLMQNLYFSFFNTQISNMTLSILNRSLLMFLFLKFPASFCFRYISYREKKSDFWCIQSELKFNRWIKHV